MSQRVCRFCSCSELHSFVDLGLTPLSNSFVHASNLDKYEVFYPLHTYICQACLLVQLEQYESPTEIFSEYAYFSSYSDSWLQHTKEYTMRMISTLGLDPHSSVIEIASNDGYLLQYFLEHEIPVLGIEPAQNVAKKAVEKGIPTVTEFFGSELALQLRHRGYAADLLIGNNVLAHVPNLNDFVTGLKILLGEQGVITMEFPHMLRFMQGNQFDTIYHEHFSYFSLQTARTVFSYFGLEMYDAEELPTHGGSLRIYAKHQDDGSKLDTGRVEQIIEQEQAAGLDSIPTYQAFSHKVTQMKRDILHFLIQKKNAGKTIVGYGAAAKGNTLINSCGIGKDFLAYVVDKNPYKQGLFLPGSRIPVYSPDKIKETKPDYVLILPWNITAEIMAQTEYIRAWGGQWIVPIPEVKVIP
ncbi:SAM-dependent methyltransferase [Paenibacillus selenitireducens]|uniref:SAM-dependent methyltransferase n=1 Tax=Paenibacillus selenitireducens TaxID=1324314 RepID=A0A1T2XL78_9BACL|nr:class I SAM-dependent methyltransferase [Paenibacillus selenitireducens]OPA80621.1 SAM-dependent methyltransferase [Paenibacillus selenitireducens]